MPFKCKPPGEAQYRQLSLHVTQEKWSWIDRTARLNKTSKAEILRYYLNMGLQAHQEAREKAIATEAHRAATVEQGAVHDGAGRRHRPNTVTVAQGEEEI